MRELLLARRLLEAVADPDATRAAVEEAGAELAEIQARLRIPGGRLLGIESFEGLAPADLSPQAWLLVLDTRGESEEDVPAEILDALFLEISDPAFRFRLVSGALRQPRTRKRYEEILEARPEPEGIEGLPDSWPKRRVRQLEALDTEDGNTARSRALQEFVLYLLQDGSRAALGLAAGAVAPQEPWRTAARDVVRAIVRSVGADLEDYGRLFRRAGI